MEQVFRVVVVAATGQSKNYEFPVYVQGIDRGAEAYANALYDQYAYKPDFIFVAMFSPYNVAGPSRFWHRGW